MATTFSVFLYLNSLVPKRLENIILKTASTFLFLYFVTEKLQYKFC